MEQAFSGLKALDLSMNLPGPYMTWILASLGADVVKVENPEGGDYARALGVASPGGMSPFFNAVNRNKRSITLNLKHPKGRGLLLDLLKDYDILIEGFRPGTMERFDLGYDVMSAVQPRLIHVSISGYGQDGPYKLRAGHDLNYLSLAGVIGMTGTSDGVPAIPGVQIADLAGGSLMALTGLFAAVMSREATGKGQFVDVSMFHGSLSLATMVFAGVESGFENPEAGKMFLNGRLPCYGLYRSKDGRYMSLGALESKFWQAFCSAANREDLLGSQFGGPEVVADVRAIFESKTRDEWVALMKEHDACCEPVVSLRDAVESELVLQRGMVSSDGSGPRQLGLPLKFSGCGPVEDAAAPKLGEHNGAVYERLGLSQDDLRDLAREGVV